MSRISQGRLRPVNLVGLQDQRLQDHPRPLVIVRRRRLRVLERETRVWRARIVVVVRRLTAMVSERRRANGMRGIVVAGRSRGLLTVVMPLTEGNVASVLPQVGTANGSVIATRTEEGIGMETVRGTEIGIVGNATRIRRIETIGTKTVNAAIGIAEMRRTGNEMAAGGRGMVPVVVVVLQQMREHYRLARILHAIAPSPRAMKLLESDGVRPMMRYVTLGLFII